MLPVLLIGAGTPTFGLMLDRVRVPIFGDILGSGSRFGLGRALMGRMGTVSEAGTDLSVADPSAWLIALTFWAGFGVLGLLVLAMTYREW
jgi:hypothetical protein